MTVAFVFEYSCTVGIVCSISSDDNGDNVPGLARNSVAFAATTPDPEPLVELFPSSI